MARSTSGTSVPLGFGDATASVGDHIAHFYRGEDETPGSGTRIDAVRSSMTAKRPPYP